MPFVINRHINIVLVAVLHVTAEMHSCALRTVASLLSSAKALNSALHTVH
jgi:hypothetical protein